MESIIIVKCNKNKAKVYLKKRTKFLFWKTVLKTRGFIGKNGLGKTKEGDNKTPIGLFNLGISFGIHENVETKLPYVKIENNMYWVDDSNSKFYEELVKVEDEKQPEATFYKSITKKEVDWNSAECLIDYKIQYEYAIHIKYNEEKQKDKGSAIFLHCINKGPTAGCIAIPKEDLKEILRQIDEDTRIYIT